MKQREELIVFVSDAEFHLLVFVCFVVVVIADSTVLYFLYFVGDAQPQANPPLQNISFERSRY